MLLDKRIELKPYEYPELQEVWEKVQKTYWIHNSIEFSADVQHYKTELTEDEKYIVGTILKSFAMTEMFVFDDFWTKVGDFMPKPEVKIIGGIFAENELRHAVAYQRLNDVLDIQDFKAFLEDPVLIERFANLASATPDSEGKYNPKDILLSLALFGCFTEYVNLFSQFAILKSFSANGRNLLPNIGTIIDYSALDEDIHAKTAIWFVNTLKMEYPEIWDAEVIDAINKAAHITFEIEMKLIDQIFERGDLPNLSKYQLINFMKNRINEALFMIDLPVIFTDIDRKELHNMSWFLDNIFAKQNSDFFYRKPTSYSKFNKTYSKENVLVTKEEIDNI